MSQIEDRLRTDLPALADALMDRRHNGPTSPTAGEAPADTASLTHRGTVRNAPSRRARVLLGAAAAAVVVVGGLALWRSPEERTSVGTADRSAAPESFGTWTTTPEGPTPAPAHPIAVWTGSEALFWAGSNLDRNHAYTEAAAYDPTSETWRDADEPGWGHPGVTGAALGGELFAVAKGSGARLDFETGQWDDLPPVDGMVFTAVVAGDDAIWGLGPSLDGLEGQPDVAIVRYDADHDEWVDGPVFEGTDDTATIVDSIGDIDRPVVWTGSDIVVWDGRAGIAFDPVARAWRVLPELRHPTGTMLTSRAVPAADGLTVVAELDDGEDVTTGIARLDAGRWSWITSDVRPIELDTATASAAGPWIVLLPADAPPITVHVPSGGWHEHIDAPIHGLEGPGTVWTGQQLVVWGGVHHGTSPHDAGIGMTWTPPTSG